MLIPKILDNKTKLVIALAFAGWLTLLACSVNTKNGEDGNNKKVDIQTPIGGFHVNEEVDVRDTGLGVYPGARQKPKTNDDNSKSANVNISSSFFGLKVVAVEYQSDDTPDKVIAFYQDQLKKYGNVIQCHTNHHGGDLGVEVNNHSSAVKCEGGNSGNVVELKVGTEDNQHLVSIEPEGKGTDFALVYIRAHGKEDSI